LGRDKTSQHYIWLIDCWKVHISREFLGWLKENHPLLHPLFVPASCTSKQHVADVVLQRPIKHRFRTQFNLWQSQQVACQVLNGVQPNDIELQLGIRELRGQVVGWMMAAWDEVAALQDMIKKGWAKCRLGEIHKLELQSKALTECLTKGLLAA
jgi:hypothetical protein